MSQPSLSTSSKHTKEQSNHKNVGTEIDLSDVITDVIPLSMFHVHARTSTSRKGKSSKVSTSSSPSMTARNIKTLESSTVVKKPRSMTSMYLDPISVEPNVGDFEEWHVMPNVMEDVEASETSNRPSQRLTPRIDKRFNNIKGQAIESSSTPSKSLRKRASVGPTKRWRKVITPVYKKKSLKRKEVPSESSDSDRDVEHNVQDIVSTARKQAFGKKIPANIPEVPIDNISFHSIENVEKWKFFYQRRLTLESELGKDAFECKEVMSLIQEAGLMKTVTGFGKCYEMLVK
ncbi:uncharacterized protein LOC127123616 [Lathyrus oleraceus]|uniref:uncharacterized protein LOC127123616 n=1 Tax=Pisum sativum TaxID=3888 RepID=UPI0021CE1832|nr:uncharacterized protein LOC127123616 [Pisum sativum]